MAIPSPARINALQNSRFSPCRFRGTSALANAAISTSSNRRQPAWLCLPPTETNEAAIATRVDGQLYTVLGKEDAQGRWQLRLWWKPWVTLIWIGGGLIALGGLLSLIGRTRRERIAYQRKAYA